MPKEYVAFVNDGGEAPHTPENVLLKQYASNGRMDVVNVEWRPFSGANREREARVVSQIENDSRVHVVVLPKRDGDGSELTDLGLLGTALASLSAKPDLFLHFPYLRYGRSDMFTDEGVSRGLTARANMIMTVPLLKQIYIYDPHSLASPAAFRGLARSVESIEPIAKYLATLGVTQVVAADNGGAKRAGRIAEILKLPDESLPKRHSADDEVVRSDTPRPSLRGQLVGLVEDEVASGRTICGAIEKAMAEGALGVHLVMLRDFAEPPFHEGLFKMDGLLSYATTSFGPGLVAGWQNRGAFPFRIIELPLVGFEQPKWLQQMAEQERLMGSNGSLAAAGGLPALRLPAG